MKSPEEFCKSIISGFKAKSSHNKNESMWCFWISMGGALAAPIFVTLGDEMAKFLGELGSVFILSKLIPSILWTARKSRETFSRKCFEDCS